MESLARLLLNNPDLDRDDAKGLEARVLCGMATVEDLGRIDIASLAEIKSKGGTNRRFIVSKGFGLEAEKRTSKGDIISTESVDRMGDRIAIKGWDLEAYKANPQILYGHDDGSGTGSFPAGMASKVRAGRSAAGQQALLADSKFHPGEIQPQAEIVWRMVEAGALPGRSVGFIPTDWKQYESPEEKQKDGVGPFGMYFLSQELLEYSVVPIPANAEATEQRNLMRKAMGVLDACRGDSALGEAAVKDFERVFAFTEDQLRERSREAKRKSIVVPGLAESLKAALVEEPEPTPDPEPEEQLDPAKEYRLTCADDGEWEVREVSEQEPEPNDPAKAIDAAVERAVGAFEQLASRVERASGASNTGSREEDPSEFFDAVEQRLQAELAARLSS